MLEVRQIIEKSSRVASSSEKVIECKGLTAFSLTIDGNSMIALTCIWTIVRRLSYRSCNKRHATSQLRSEISNKVITLLASPVRDDHKYCNFCTLLIEVFACIIELKESGSIPRIFSRTSEGSIWAAAQRTGPRIGQTLVTRKANSRPRVAISSRGFRGYSH